MNEPQPTWPARNAKDLPLGKEETREKPSTRALAQLLEEQRQCWRQGRGVRAETYLQQQPALRADREAVLDLIYHEILLREAAGEVPQLDEYRQRFPEFAADLTLQFEVDRALDLRLLTAT